jgi:hypothetical protein
MTEIELPRKALELITYGRSHAPMEDRSDHWIYANYYLKLGIAGMHHRGPAGVMTRGIYTLAVLSTPRTSITCAQRAHNKLFPERKTFILPTDGELSSDFAYRMNYTQTFYPSLFLKHFVYEWITHFIGITVANSYQLRNGTTQKIAAKNLQRWIDQAWVFLPTSFQMS